MRGVLLQPCATQGVLVVTLDYIDNVRRKPQKACSVRVRDALGTVVHTAVHTTFTRVSVPLANDGCYTVEIDSLDWSAPVNVIYRGNVRKDCHTSVLIPLRTPDTIVPKLIHFIWAGGTRLMPPQNIDAVKAWAKTHHAQGFEVRIWIDETHAPGTRARYADFGLPCDVPKITLPDITAEGVSSPHVRYEIDRLRSNYGASSDMLRYNILYRFGGAYFDSDVHPGAHTLNHDGLFDQGNTQLFLVDNNSQGKGLIGNDAFICATHQPLMRAIAAAAENNYREAFPEMGSRVYDYDAPATMQNSTIVRTGPMAVSTALHVAGKLRPSARTTDAANNVIQVTFKEIARALRLNQVLDEHWMDNRYVRPEAQNQGNWMKVPIKKVKEPQDALAVVVATMRFEAAHMGLLRLDPHVRDLAEALGQPFTERGEPTAWEDAMARMLMKAVVEAGVDLRTAQAGPMMTRFGGLRALCYAQGLIGLPDGKRIQMMRPLHADGGPRSVPGSVALFLAQSQGMSACSVILMGIHFLENALLRAAREVQAAPRDDETAATVDAVREHLRAMDSLYAEHRARFSSEDGEDARPSTREFLGNLLVKLERRVAILLLHTGPPQALPLPPLPLAWRECTCAPLYGQ